MPAIVRPERGSRGARERDVLADVREDLGQEPNLVLWRNAIVEREIEGRWVRGGLPEGSPDLVGILRDARGVGRFFALEIKAPGARTSPGRALRQAQFAALIRLFGGFCAQVSSKAEARAALARARVGESQ